MKFYDLGLQDPSLRAELDAAWRRVLDSGWMILGPEVEAFEAEFASFCGVRHAIGVGNGLDALVLSLRAAGVGEGHDVIVPSHTFAATWLAVTAVGARPVPVEPDERTYVIGATGVEAALTPATRAIIPVSLYGHPVDMAPIMALGDERGLFVLEDAAQSQGARCRGARTGGLAHATAFSFYPTKNLGALGDAGCVTTNDDAIAARLRTLRNYGSLKKYLHEVVGVNSRLDELQAAFLRVRLARLMQGNAARRQLAADYDRALASVDGLQLPSAANWAEPAHHLYVVRTPRRDALQAGLRARGIETLIHYPIACHAQPAFADLGLREDQFPLAERLSHEVLSLPFWPGMPDDDVARVAAAVRETMSALARSA